MIPQQVTTWLVENDFGDVNSSYAVAGGCINNGQILKTVSGKSFFLKTNRRAPSDMFAREVEGLEALRVDGGPVVPEPYLFGGDFILLEDLTPSSPSSDYWPEFGRQLATLHNHNNSQFGFDHDNYIGSTLQPNPWTDNGYEFFGASRLMYMTRLARDRNLMGSDDAHRVEKLVSKLPDLIPQQPASLIHGDLWSGNATSDSNGEPAIIDPATHYGWAEAELAMTSLFGSFPGAFFAAYEEVRPLENSYRSRFAIYNLYHLLNHLNIFGRSYLGQVQSIIHQYS
ncbi:MAG: fructosamine kinase family protein [Anaerolineales bacterium]|nr:fructosamine kinase family protein [Chloroflexota bacterium]MBL6980576.1 fructosamine kinase family protein [Anaerolineales bacterium]